MKVGNCNWERNMEEVYNQLFKDSGVDIQENN